MGGFAGAYLRPQHYERCITDTTTGILDGETKFVLIKNALSATGVQSAFRQLRRLKFGDVRNSNRTMLHRSHGGEMVMGYLRWPVPRVTRPTIRFPRAYLSTILPLCLTLQQLMTQYWPTAAESQALSALDNGDRLIGSELRTFTDVLATPIFSSVTINNTVIFPSHVDGRNLRGPACITAFGNWSGGALCLPRLRVAFPLQPGDVLIADTTNEQHGKVGPLSTDLRCGISPKHGYTGYDN